MTKYYVRGTVSVEINDGDFIFSITPAQQFVTPDKENQRIVAFSYKPRNKLALTAKLVGKFKQCKVSNEKLQNALFTLSVQRSLVELYIKPDGSKNWEIIGLKFPV